MRRKKVWIIIHKNMWYIRVFSLEKGEGNGQMKTTMISSWMHEDTFVDKTLFPRVEPVLSPLCAVRAMYSF